MGKKWCKFADLKENGFQSIAEKPGIYFARYVKDGTPVPINRLCGCDRKGLLYIGESKNLKKEIQSLWKGIEKQNSESHTVGMTIVFCKIFELISSQDYEVLWKELRSKEDEIAQEWKALGLYCEKYKEPPPLNLKLSRESYATIGILRIGDDRKRHGNIAADIDKFVKSIIDS